VRGAVTREQPGEHQLLHARADARDDQDDNLRARFGPPRTLSGPFNPGPRAQGQGQGPGPEALSGTDIQACYFGFFLMDFRRNIFHRDLTKIVQGWPKLRDLAQHFD
jgi:hypothetical protein